MYKKLSYEELENRIKELEAKALGQKGMEAAILEFEARWRSLMEEQTARRIGTWIAISDPHQILGSLVQTRRLVVRASPIISDTVWTIRRPASMGNSTLLPRMGKGGPVPRISLIPRLLRRHGPRGDPAVPRGGRVRPPQSKTGSPLGTWYSHVARSG